MTYKCDTGSTGHNTSIDRPEGYRVTNTYNTNRLLTKAEVPAGTLTSVSYNSMHLVEISTDPLDNRTTYQYDEVGNQTQVTDALGCLSTSVFGVNSRMIVG